ncbi:MAG: FliA/WhiG family RNA polymerase sigma factor [Sporolactobacillus sp.]
MEQAKAAELQYWERWYAEHDREAADYLLKRYLPLVQYHVQRIGTSMPKSVDREELMSYGLVGLYDALEKFDRQRDLKFDTYASFRVRGAILDGLRQQDWMPRSVREKSKKIEKVSEHIEQRYMRSATLEEVAAACEMTPEEVSQILSEGMLANLLSLNDMAGEGGADSAFPALEDRAAPQPEKRLIDKENRRLLAEQIDRLGDKERTVVSLFYYEGLTLTEIGQVMDLSTSRISQIHSKALFKLRQYLRSDNNRWSG